MENKNEKAINRIEKVLNDTELLETQRKTLVAFDRFNDLESGCRLSTRLGYILTVRDLALATRKPFTGMTREDLQQFIAEQKKRHTPSSVATYETHLKRFFRWLGWVKTNEGKPDEEKVEVKDVKLPYNVRWMSGSYTPPEIEYDALPTARARAFKGTKKRLRENKFDDKLASAITSMNARISKDKKTVILELEGKRISIPVTVEKLDELAQKSDILVGKWLIYKDKSEIDDVWKTIAKATFNGELGKSAKVSTAMQNNRRYVICVYTKDYLDLEDVMMVREKLRLLGFTDKLCYKPDPYTYLGIYYRTTHLSPCKYRN